MGQSQRTNMSAEEEKQVQGTDSSGEEVQACLMGGSWTESRKGSPEDCMPPQQYGYGWQGFGMGAPAHAHHLAAPAAPNHLRGHAQRFGAWPGLRLRRICPRRM